MKHLIAFAILLLSCSIAMPSAFAQTDIGLKGVGVEIGLVGPENVDATIGVGLFVNLGSFAPNFLWEAHIDYWSETENIVGGGRATVRDAAIGSRTRYMFPVSNSRVEPFVGAGLALHFVRAEFYMPAQSIDGIVFVQEQDFSNTDTKLGLDMGGGLITAINDNADFIGELWYGIVDNVNQISFKLGVAVKFDL